MKSSEPSQALEPWNVSLELMFNTVVSRTSVLCRTVMKQNLSHLKHKATKASTKLLSTI